MNVILETADHSTLASSGQAELRTAHHVPPTNRSESFARLQSGAFAEPKKMLLGLIGSGIQLSLTPAMHEAEASYHGLRVHYQLIDLALADRDANALPALIEAVAVMGFSGVNITYPCKQKIIPLLSELSDDARAMGAVNTVIVDGTRLIGHNTDGSGWRRGFEMQIGSANLSHVVLLGAGGAGAAIAHAVLSMGCERLSVIDRDHARAVELSETLSLRFKHRKIEAIHFHEAARLLETIRDADGLIHATPTGTAHSPGMPISASLLQAHHWVSEIVYFPIETEFFKAAKACGCRVMDGGAMAVGQAIDAFALFTGQTPNAERMTAHFQQVLAARDQLFTEQAP